MIDKIEQKLLDLKSAIEEDKTKKAQLEGAISELMRQLKDKFEISEDDIDSHLEKLEHQKLKSENEIKTDFEKLTKLYEW